MSKLSELINWVFDLTKEKVITQSESHLLLVIVYRCGNKMECWPSKSDLAEKTGFPYRTITRLRSSLINKGVISLEGYKGRQKQIRVMKVLKGDTMTLVPRTPCPPLEGGTQDTMSLGGGHHVPSTQDIVSPGIYNMNCNEIAISYIEIDLTKRAGVCLPPAAPPLTSDEVILNYKKLFDGEVDEKESEEFVSRVNITHDNWKNNIFFPVVVLNQKKPISFGELLKVMEKRINDIRTMEARSKHGNRI